MTRLIIYLDVYTILLMLNRGIFLVIWAGLVIASNMAMGGGRGRR